ncbi:MAG: hypothetical protein AAGA68_20595, partial [Pseudomonadota bacterium]
ILDKVRDNPRRVVFAEGEEDRMIRAANSYASAGLGCASSRGTCHARPRAALRDNNSRASSSTNFQLRTLEFPKSC